MSMLNSSIEMQDEPTISLVVPFYNEGGGVDLFFARVLPILRALKESFEIVCVDDGSKDDTLACLMRYAGQDSSIRVLELSRNFGKEPALTAGIDHANGLVVVPMDADLQDPPELIASMLKAWREGADVVVARRVDRSTDSYLKRVTAKLFYRLHNRVSDTKIPDNVGDFRLMSRPVVDALKQLPERQRFMKGLFAWVGFRTTVVDYVRENRSFGKTKFSGWKLWNFALEGFTSFSTAPLRIWTYVGIIGTLLTLGLALFIVVRTLIHGVDVPGYASLLVSVLFLGSLQLLSIGLLGEYIGRIYLEAKQRPNYIVRKIYTAIDHGS
jgi:polyisoprenyl-phosphate glycosyltransferase